MTTTNNENKPNVELIYEYTNGIYSDTSSNISSLDTRLATTMGFGGLLLRFSDDLANGNWWQLTLKLTVSLLIAFSVCLALKGFLSGPSGTLIKPKALLDRWYYLPDEECRLLIIREWSKSIDEFNSLRVRKSKCLNLSVAFLVLSVVFFGVGIWLDSIFI
jgi:hypothetical protein